MKYFLLSLLFVGRLAAQTLTLSLSPPSVYPGQSVTLTLTYTDSAVSANVAGLEWSYVLPAGLTLATPVIGTAGTTAAKTLACNGPLCIVYGLNITTFGSGAVATATITVPSTQAAGTMSVSLSQAEGATDQGVAVNLVVGPSVSVLVLNKADLNGDGVVNIDDVQIALSQALGTTGCTNGDINGNGKCDLIDVLLVVKAALGI